MPYGYIYKIYTSISHLILEIDIGNLISIAEIVFEMSNLQTYTKCLEGKNYLDAFSVRLEVLYFNP